MAKEYYSITTKKFTLRTSHFGWLETTRNLYNDILEFYYSLYLEHEELHGMNSQMTMRGLEQLTIVGRDKKAVPEPLPWKKVPLYFRRAAINEAIAAGKSYLGRMDGKKMQDMPTQAFASGVTFYKGMYEELTSRSVNLKVYDGEKWRWLHCRLSGNELPEDAEYMSPRLVFKPKQTELHVPVRMRVDDGRKLKDRMNKNLRICSLRFTNTDACVVCCVMDHQGEIQGVRFVRGGRDYEARCRLILDKIEQSAKAVGGNDSQGDNRKYWQRLRDISEDMAHQVSCEILDFCVKYQVSVIVIPRYSTAFTYRMMRRAGAWSALKLGNRIREKMNYKAWKEGVLVVEIESSDISRYCSICGSVIQKKGEDFICPNRHRGNRHMNSARNLGKKFLSNMKKQKKDMP